MSAEKQATAGKAEHTKLPWYVGTQNDSYYIINTKPRPVPTDYLTAGDPNTVVIAKVCFRDVKPDIEQANAELIVRAVNCHQELVDALKMYVAAVGNTAAFPDRQLLKAAYEKSEQALAHAEARL